MKKFIIFGLTILFSLSAAAVAGQIMTEALDSWKGENINRAIDFLDYPEKEKTIAGRHLYYWKKNIKTGQDVYGYKTQYYCELILEVDSKDTIIGNSWNGNNCPIMYSGYPGAKRFFNPAKDQRRLEKQTKKAVKAESKLEKENENNKTE